MHQGNWKCSKCGGPITELPFEPRSEAGLTCRTCYMKQKDGEGGGGASPAASTDMAPADSVPQDTTPADAAPQDAPPPDDDSFNGAAGDMQADVPEGDYSEEPDVPNQAQNARPKFTGDWKCAGCGNAITSLPFQPRSTENLKCIDCFKKG